MKYNRKKRKQKYIRHKNHLRQGGSLVAHLKMTKQEDIAIEESMVSEAMEYEKNRFEKRFKILGLKIKNVICVYDADVFFPDIMMVKFEIGL